MLFLLLVEGIEEFDFVSVECADRHSALGASVGVVIDAFHAHLFFCFDIDNEVADADWW